MVCREALSRHAATLVQPTGGERRFHEDELIVSKTDLKGVITYANQVFCRIVGYTEEELVGQPHNIVRHPDMPRSVFKLMWDIIQSGEEMFGYVLNLAKNGDHYWSLPTSHPRLTSTETSGYHSNRRVPEPAAVATAGEVYGCSTKNANLETGARAWWPRARCYRACWQRPGRHRKSGYFQSRENIRDFRQWQKMRGGAPGLAVWGSRTPSTGTGSRKRLGCSSEPPRATSKLDCWGSASAPEDVARMALAVNSLLDRTDAFVREAGASLDHASHGKFFRRVLERAY